MEKVLRKLFLAFLLIFLACSDFLNEEDDVVGDPVEETPAPVVPTPISTPEPGCSTDDECLAGQFCIDNICIENDDSFTPLINEARMISRNCGEIFFGSTHPIERNSLLDSAAFRHSLDMFENDFFSHTGSNGSFFGDRIRESGYNYKAAGEAIGLGYSNEESVLDGWLNSPGHCKLVMSPSFTEYGLGEVEKRWTLDLATK